MSVSAREMLERLRTEQNARARLNELRRQQEQQTSANTTPFPLPAAPSLAGGAGARDAAGFRALSRAATVGSPTTQAAARSGVDVLTGAPVGRVQAGFAQNQALRAADLERRLSEHYGQQVPMRVGPDSGQLEFLNPRTNRYTLVDESRFTSRDLPEAIGPAITGGAALAGELLGGPVGAGAGGALGEGTRRAIGQYIGVRDETVPEAIRGSLGVGAVEGAASGAGNLIARGAQRARDLFTSSGLSAREAARALEASTANQVVAEEISRRTGQRFQPFTGQLSGDPLLLGEQSRILSSRQTGEAARAQLRQNETTLERFFDIVTPSGGGPRTSVGRSIQQEAREQTQPRVDAIEAGVQRQVADLEALTASLPFAQSEQLGNEIRRQIEEARGALKVSEDSAWEGVRRGYGYNADTALSQYKVPITGDLAQTLRRLQAEAEQAIDPATAAGKSQLVPEGLTAGEVDLHQLQVYLSSLRRRERISRQSTVATDPEGRDISRVRDALLVQRNEYLKNVDPELLAEIEAAEGLTAKRAALFDKGLVGGLLRKVDGGYAITNSEVIGRTIASGNSEAIRHLVSALDQHPAGLDVLRRAMLATYRNEVVQNGIPQAALHARFIDRHGATLDALFPYQSQIRQLGNFEAIVSRNLKRFEDFRTGIERSFRGRIQDLAPERIAENALSSSFSVKDVGRIMALAQAAGVKQQYQRAIGDQIRRRFTSPTSGLNLNSLEKFVQQHSEKLYAIYGQQYMRDMRLLLSGLKTARTTAGGISVTRNPTLLEALARTTVARPLSPGGVALTRLSRFRAAARERALGQAIMDPQALRAIVQQGRNDVRSQKVAQILAVLGASTLAVNETE